MITYRYGPYRPGDDDSSWDLDKLSRILSDMIMKYDIGLEEALRMLIERGLPVNLFIKEEGMYDLLDRFIHMIDEKIRGLLRGSDASTNPELHKEIEELENIRTTLNGVVEKGELFPFNIEKLAKYLGPEAYAEFIERRDRILKMLSEVLERAGFIVHEAGKGELKLSPSSIRRIGRSALEAIFSSLRADSGGGSHTAQEPGESENVSSISRKYQFGDPVSGIDLPASILNALIRTGRPKPTLNDLELFEPRGESKSATVVLLDMSGSMMRDDRFYNAKRVVLALDALIRQEYREESLTVVGFGSLAKAYGLAELVSLKPFPITMYDPHIRLRFNLSKMSSEEMEHLPRYFTNLERGLSLSRRLLGSRETRNRQIILITDGVPTAHMEKGTLCVNYPPSPADFEYALREVTACRKEEIVINTFLLTSDWERSYFGEDSFISSFAKHSMGRIFYPRPDELDQLVLIDFIENKKSIIKY
jgi:uncharacterized protein with von Willebrand factor type A (vWA) domain